MITENSTNYMSEDKEIDLENPDDDDYDVTCDGYEFLRHYGDVTYAFKKDGKDGVIIMTKESWEDFVRINKTMDQENSCICKLTCHDVRNVEKISGVGEALDISTKWRSLEIRMPTQLRGAGLCITCKSISIDELIGSIK